LSRELKRTANTPLSSPRSPRVILTNGTDVPATSYSPASSTGCEDTVGLFFDTLHMSRVVFEGASTELSIEKSNHVSESALVF
jgi:hypothetical protein